MIFKARFLLTAEPQACAGLVLHVVFLTAQPQACTGLVLHGVFFFNRAAVGWAVYARQGVYFFFSFVGDLA